MNDKITTLIAGDEGRNVNANGRHMPYRDSLGILTIGYGRNIQQRGISEEEARMLLTDDITSTKIELGVHIPWMSALDDVRQAVLIDMAFNMGVPDFMEFTETLKYTRNKDFSNAAREMLNSKWATEVKSRATELSQMMKTGEWPERVGG